MGIKVRAIRLGWYGKQRRRPGAEFEIKSLQELGTWMERLNKPGPKSKQEAGEQSPGSDDEPES